MIVTGRRLISAGELVADEGDKPNSAASLATTLTVEKKATQPCKAPIKD
jgi:hypothetical protein